jgi:hypothetical protein
MLIMRGRRVPQNKNEMEMLKMAKATKAEKAVTPKKEFAWDKQTRLGEYGDAKVRHEVFINELNGKKFIGDTAYLKTADGGEKRTKSVSMELGNFKQLADFITGWELTSAFGSDSTLQVVEKVKAPKTTKAKAPKK